MFLKMLLSAVCCSPRYGFPGFAVVSAWMDMIESVQRDFALWAAISEKEADDEP